MKEKVINPTISLSPETLLEEIMWPAARYCIGRQTYVSDYANTYARIIRDNREKFNQDRLLFFAGDIREKISSILSYRKNVVIHGSANNEIKMDAYSLIAKWLEENPEARFCDHNFLVNCKSCSVETAKRAEPLYKFREPYECVEMLYASELLPWIELANLIDESTHVRVTTEWGGKQSEHLCIPCPEAEQIYDHERHYTIDYAYHTAYRTIEKIGSGWRIAPECIVKIEEV